MGTITQRRATAADKFDRVCASLPSADRIVLLGHDRPELTPEDRGGRIGGPIRGAVLPRRQQDEAEYQLREHAVHLRPGASSAGAPSAVKNFTGSVEHHLGHVARHRSPDRAWALASVDAQICA